MAFPYPYVGPIAPYNNVPINTTYYKPSEFVITAITRGSQTTVTTSTTQNYVIGQNVRFIIPPTFGIRELNEQTGIVVSIPSTTQVVVAIDSSKMNPFTSSSATTKPQIVPIGDVNSGQINSSGPASTLNYIPGAFQDISPL